MAEPFICAVCQNAVGNFVGNLFSEIFTLISKPIILVSKCNNNVDNLKQQVDKLKHEKQTVENYAEAVDRRGEEIQQNFQNWLTSANNRIEAAGDLVADAEGNAKKKCFFGLCLNPKSRYQLSKKAKENSVVIVDLVNEARGFNLPLSYIPAPPKEVAAPVKGFEDFNSRSDVLEKIMEALRSQSSRIIGVHGMPGMGKTMLAKEVKRKAEQDKLFNVVVFALVSRNADSKKIQVEIARGLGLDQLPNGITTKVAAERIRGRLKKMKKVLIILDDIWRPGIDLEELGIPLRNEPKTIEGSSSREEYAECKILLTSRDSNVLSDLMGSQQNFPLHQLEDKEAWELLKSIVGDRAESEDIRRAATEIVRKCEGLPLAITTMAKALKNKEPCEWMDAVRILKRPCSENFSRIYGSVYSAIEFSYCHLESEKLQKTFLLCCLMGHKFLIQDLLKYGVGLGLFANTIEEAQNEVSILINKLRASSLLIDDSDNIRLDMHDLIHDVAVSIASRHRHGLLLTDDHVPKEWSEMETRKDFKWICLRYANVDGLPEEFESVHLTLFRLANKNPSLQIPANFFKGMPRLKVLALTHMRLSSLPSSICLLQNIHTLCLNQSELGNIRIIGELKNLEILSLGWSDFEELPCEIGQLTRLKLLDMSNCTKLKIIPPGVLANMSRLEELYLGNSFDGWEVEENENQRNASIAELKHLKKLTTLEVCIPDLQTIPKDLFFENLKKFKIFIGSKWAGRSGSSESSRILKLHLNASISFNYLVKMLLKMTEELHLRELAGVKNVVDELNAEGFPDLKHLYVRNAPEVQHIIKSTEGVPFNAFPSLDVLFLQNLINLEKIFQGRFKETAFNKLRVITIERCDKVKNLFSSSIARQLLHLQEMSVTDCSNMEEIVDDEEQGSRNDIVEATEPKFGEVLRSLRLQGLPKLSSLNKSCRRMPLFNEQVAFPNLEELEMSWINVNTIWHASITASHVAKVTKLIIEGCGNLEHLFPSSMARDLVVLGQLKIRNCNKMREVLTENVEENGNLIFPQLRILEIESLPKLERFCHGNDIEFTCLSRLLIMCCPVLAAFASSFPSYQKKEITTNDTESEERPVVPTQPFFGDKVAFPNLEELQLSWINVNTIGYTSITSSVEKLTRLIIEGCNNLEYLFLSSMARSLVMLEDLNIWGCNKMREVIFAENVEENENLILPRLRSLWIQNLPKLKRFCSGNYIKFPRLLRLTINTCPVLKTFTSSSIFGHITATRTPPLFDRRVTFPKLQRLIIESLESLDKIWDNQLDADSFSQLNYLKVRYCGKLLNIFPFSMLEKLHILNKLEIRNCDSLEEIFEFQGLGVGQSQYQNITHLTLVEPVTKFVFPTVKYLNLAALPKLKAFCHQMHTTEWPSLKKLKVFGCDHVQIFASELSSFPRTKGDDQLEIQTKCPLFWISKATFPCLEELELNRNGIMEIWHGQCSGDYFPKLTRMGISACDMLKENVVCLNDEVKDGIVVFSQLKYLELRGLS